MKFVYRMSKLFHKYLGLTLSLFLLWMGASGILINHPGALKKVELPRDVLPRGYEFDNWNRGSFQDGIILDGHPGAVVVAGGQGLWLSRDHGQTFESFNRGLPPEKAVFCLVQDTQGLYAGTKTGVYGLELPPELWDASGLKPVWKPMTGLEDKGVTSLFFMENTLVAGTDSGLFQWAGEGGFLPLDLPDLPGASASVSLAGLLLSIHDGSILGLPGKLVVDLTGLVLVFLSLSGVYVWFLGGRLGAFKGKRRYLRLFRFCYSRHLKWGIWFSLVLIPITITGFLVRPPFLILLYKHVGPRIDISASPGENSWEGQIDKACFFSNSILVSTRRGFYQIPLDSEGKLGAVEGLNLPIRISGMGTTVLKPLSHREFLVGSFAGMALLDGKLNKVWSLPPRTRVAGALSHGEQIRGYIDFHKGYTPLNHTPNFRMPPSLNGGGKTSLWFLMFELHNGRIFSGLLGPHTWMIIPLGGMLCLLTLFTGCFDWAYRKGYLRSTPNSL